MLGYPARSLFLIPVLLFGALTINAQETQDKTGNWMMFFSQIRLDDNWSIHSEIQWRNHEISPNLEQMLIRGGINYHIDNNFMVTGGYGYISSHPFDKEITRTLSNEHRLYQQLIIKNSVSRLYFQHRYRYEQRWVNGDFRQRARYRLLVSIPLNTSTMQKGSIFFSVYDELFMNLKKGSAFDRNRLYAALGYKFSDMGNFQLGYLRQTNPAFGKNYLQFALFYNLDFRRAS